MLSTQELVGAAAGAPWRTRCDGVTDTSRSNGATPASPYGMASPSLIFEQLDDEDRLSTLTDDILCPSWGDELLHGVTSIHTLTLDFQGETPYIIDGALSENSSYGGFEHSGIPDGIPQLEEYLAVYCSMSARPWPAANWKLYIASSLFRGASIYAGVYHRWTMGNASGGEHARFAGKAGNVMVDCAWDYINRENVLRAHPARGAIIILVKEKVMKLRHKIMKFMKDHIYPKEDELYKHAQSTSRWTIHPEEENLKALAKEEGLWNLFIPLYGIEQRRVLALASIILTRLFPSFTRASSDFAAASCQVFNELVGSPFYVALEKGIFDALLKGHLDLESDPSPKISDSAKDLIRKMLCNFPSERLTAHEVLPEWLLAPPEGIKSVTGVDEEGCSRQRILTFAAKRYISTIERNPEDPDPYYNWALVLQESADNVDPNSDSSKDSLLEEACKKYAEATRRCPTLYGAYDVHRCYLSFTPHFHSHKVALQKTL
ncbi:hypothetical protein ZWY2020_052239 [Hordeum vulgare]|nr:hypothetical protein ZWY2020_052239 [Hordeum vulgare]